MPLPSALLSKLSKRGIVSAQKLQKPSAPNPEKEKLLLIVDFCPNKYNIFHECSAWCQANWKGFASPEPRYAKNMKVALSKYPLPPKWIEVFDKGIGCYYYWNTETDQVSWLPPKHPKALIGESAAKQRIKMLKAEQSSKLADVPLPPQNAPESHRDSASSKSTSSTLRDKDRTATDRRKVIHKNWHKYDEKGRCEHSSSHHRKRARRDDLDPMDPAAYSDVPRGSWSDGLEVSKGKADSTAVGALFQQRPYPAPGEVLAANKHRK